MKGRILFRGLLCTLLLSLVSCGGTEFYEKAPGIEGISDGGDGTANGHIADPTQDVIVDDFTYTQNQEQAPVDILFVVDDSGSMGDNQASLAENFDAFIADFVTRGIDFNMAITTTDMDPGKAGMPVAGSMEALTYDKYLQNSSQFLTDFSNMIKVGTSGSGYEKGLGGSRAFLEDYQAAFVRSDAHLTVIYVSDEEDQSADAVSDYVDYLKSVKGGNASKVQAHSIVHANNGVYTGTRYMDAAAQLNGTHEDIGNNFAQTLGNISTNIINNIQNYTLSATPDLSSLIVKVDGQVLSGQEWAYNASKNSIEFLNGLGLGAEIKVYYYAL